MNRKYTSEEIDWLKRNYSQYSAQYCAEYLNRTEKSIIQKMYMQKIQRRPKELMDKNIQFIRDNVNHLGTIECGKILKMTQSWVSLIVKKYNIFLDKVQSNNRRREKLLQHNGGEKVSPINFKIIDTEEKAYICGVLWGDGYVNDYFISLKASKLDLNEIIEVFRTTGLWKYYILGKKKRSIKPQAEIKTSNVVLSKLFHSYGYKTKSVDSPNIILNLIPIHLHYMYWRGYFDADGHCSANSYCVSSTINQNWDCLEHLFKYLNISYTITKTERKDSKYSHIIIYSRKQIYTLYNYIYPPLCKQIGYSRKHNQFKKALNYLENVNINKIKKENRLFLTYQFNSW